MIVQSKLLDLFLFPFRDQWSLQPIQTLMLLRRLRSLHQGKIVPSQYKTGNESLTSHTLIPRPVEKDTSEPQSSTPTAVSPSDITSHAGIDYLLEVCAYR